MANKQMKIYSASLACREMYIRSTVRCCLTPNGMVTTKTQTLASAGKTWKSQSPHPPLVGGQHGAATLENNQTALPKVKHGFTT